MKNHALKISAGLATFSLLTLGVTGCDGGASALEGEWSCTKFGDTPIFFDDLSGERGFGIYSGYQFQLTVEGDAWETAALPTDPSTEIMMASGTFSTEGDQLEFSIDEFGFDQGGGFTPFEEYKPMDLEVKGIPEKLDEVSMLEADRSNGPERFVPTPHGFKVESSSEDFIDCARQG